MLPMRSYACAVDEIRPQMSWSALSTRTVLRLRGLHSIYQQLVSRVSIAISSYPMPESLTRLIEICLALTSHSWIRRSALLQLLRQWRWTIWIMEFLSLWFFSAGILPLVLWACVMVLLVALLYLHLQFCFIAFRFHPSRHIMSGYPILCVCYLFVLHLGMMFVFNWWRSDSASVVVAWELFVIECFNFSPIKSANVLNFVLWFHLFQVNFKICLWSFSEALAAPFAHS